MKKSVHLACFAIFLLVQTLSVSHQAAHGFLEHDHDGKTCDIYLYCQSSSFADAPAQPTYPAPLPATESARPRVEAGVSSDLGFHFLARAPPRSPSPH